MASLRGLSRRTRSEAALREAFASMDHDGNGVIDATELQGVLKGMGLGDTPEEVAELLAQLDLDNDGSVDYQEFKRVMSAKAEDEEVDRSIDELLSVFNSLDIDATGSLSADELQRGLKILGVKLSLDEVAVLIEEVDTDGDGEISYDEFVDYVMNFEVPDGSRHYPLDT
ncbi:hypothetical protein N2152v2_003574 [Parachlorella kessleri]